MDNANQYLKKTHPLFPLICLGLIDNFSDLLLHQFTFSLLLDNLFPGTCKLNNNPLVLQVCMQTIMNSLEIEKVTASDNNNAILLQKHMEMF